MEYRRLGLEPGWEPEQGPELRLERGRGREEQEQEEEEEEEEERIPTPKGPTRLYSKKCRNWVLLPST